MTGRGADREWSSARRLRVWGGGQTIFYRPWTVCRGRSAPWPEGPSELDDADSPVPTSVIGA